MNIARFSVTRPVAVTMRIAALTLLGIVCLLRLPIDLLPKVDIPTVVVNTSWPNTSPEEIETQLTRPIEQAVSSVPGLYNVSSTSQLGQSSVRVQLDYGVNVDQAASDVLQFVQRAARSFPNDPNLQNPTVFKFDPSALPILIYGVSGIDDPIKLRTILDNEIAPIIEASGGIAQVNITGGQERSILVEVDPDKLEAYGVGLADIVRRLQAENISVPAGIAADGGKEYSIRSIGYFTSLADAKAMPIGSYQGRNLTLGEVADIRDASQEQRIFTKLNGEPSVAVSVTKQSGANTVDAVKNVEAKVKEIAKRYPELKFGKAYDQSGFIEKSIIELQETAIIGGILAIIVIMFFLRSVRSTLVVALSIPVSIISTFALMYFLGFTLNTISLSGLALATGLIVDDAIVVLENIFRHIERDGKKAAAAAVTGTQEIMSAVVASTFTVMVVFLPLLLIKGQSGQTFTQFALVVIFSIAVSLLDAVTVVPMLASRVIREEDVEEEAHPELRQIRGKKVGPITKMFDAVGRFFNRMDAAYHSGLKWAIQRRWWVIGGAVGLTLSVLPLVPLIGTETLPKTDTGDFTVRVRLPIGTELDTTYEKMMQVEKVLLAEPEVETILLAAGANFSIRGTTGSGNSNEGSATVRLKADRKIKTEDVIKRLQRKLAAIAGIRPLAQPYDLVANSLAGNNQGIEVDIFGQDIESMLAQAREVQAVLQNIPGLESVDLAIQDASPELQWKVDRQKAAQLGVSFSDIASAIGTATSGSLSTYYQDGGFQYPIYVQVPVEKRRSIASLKELPVKTIPGDPPRQITLGQVAKPEIGTGPNQITRLNRQRFVAVNGRVVDRSESEVQADITAAMNKIEFSSGMYWSFGDQQLRRQREFGGLGFSVLLAIALIYMLLATQFESFIYPLIILCSVPLCVVGVVLALFLTDRAFSLTAYVGILMLIGIVVKNGILLVDYTNQLRARGMGRDEAILTASPTRLRPILMTSLCASLGMLPLALGVGASSELQAPLATAVVGGLATSTFLTLFVVPVVYTFFDDLARR
ncbi:MAG: efflux RND transporter permease subunit, partial [Chlorobia bacterium]|nr:efflux RND transporter permease subunit [Fimbriimonadaceae bacterium]